MVGVVAAHFVAHVSNWFLICRPESGSVLEVEVGEYQGTASEVALLAEAVPNVVFYGGRI